MVSAKTFTAYLSVYELANYSSVKTFDIFFSLDVWIVPYFRAQKLQTLQYMYFLRLVLLKEISTRLAEMGKTTLERSSH